MGSAAAGGMELVERLSAGAISLERVPVGRSKSGHRPTSGCAIGGLGGRDGHARECVVRWVVGGT